LTDYARVKERKFRRVLDRIKTHMRDNQ